MLKIKEFFSTTRVILGTLGIMISGTVYAYNYLHMDYLTKIGITKILTHEAVSHSIQENLNDITDLRINQGYALTQADQFRIETLVKVKEVRILGLREKLLVRQIKGY